MNEFEKYLLISGVEIKKEIERIMLDFNTVVNNQAPSLKKIYKLFLNSFEGGKYIRGTLIKLGFEINGKTISNEILRIAAAYEILHTSLLIQDDVIDRSKIRRGISTIHSTFKDSHHGVSQTICLSDLGFFIATKIITETNFNSDIKNKILAHFSDTIINTVFGQMLDIKTSYEKNKRERDVLTIHKLKTAYYTITAPLLTGVILSKRNSKQIVAIKKFGEYLGIAYQIKDDILGIFGNEISVGKSINSDIKENKNSLLISYALKKASLTQKIYLKRYYGNRFINQKQLEKIRSIFKTSGALAYSQKQAERYIQEAKKILFDITPNKKYQKYLLQLTDFVTLRKK